MKLLFESPLNCQLSWLGGPSLRAWEACKVAPLYLVLLCIIYTSSPTSCVSAHAMDCPDTGMQHATNEQEQYNCTLAKLECSLYVSSGGTAD